MVFLQCSDVQRGRGPPAPFPQLPILEEEVEGGQGDAGLSQTVAERVGHPTVQVGELAAVLPIEGEGQRSEPQEEGGGGGGIYKDNAL